MGRGSYLTTSERQLRAERSHQMTLIYTVMACLVSIIFFQFLLLTVAWEAYLGYGKGVVLPTALLSGMCFVAACWLMRYIPRSERL
jgi:uncharacterized protein with PIN domain